jgi:hypothetical protein
MTFRLSRAGLVVGLVAVLAIMMASAPSTQNLASNKAWFAEGLDDVVLIQGQNPGVVLAGALKTSNVGDLMIGVSMECALWTATKNKAPKGGGNTNAKARAAVNITVWVDGVAANPGQVVYCDREQEVNLEFESLDALATDAITLELFLKTKNANHFNFFVKNPGSGVHNVVVTASAIVSPDPNALAGSTRAAYGKRTLIIEEFNSSN